MSNLDKILANVTNLDGDKINHAVEVLIRTGHLTTEQLDQLRLTPYDEDLPEPDIGAVTVDLGTGLRLIITPTYAAVTIGDVHLGLVPIEEVTR